MKWNNLVGGYLIERFFWRTGLTVWQMQLIHVPLALGINLAAWTLGPMGMAALCREVWRPGGSSVA